jgi:predicted SAM-dependent methyltransferase
MKVSNWSLLDSYALFRTRLLNFAIKYKRKRIRQILTSQRIKNLHSKKNILEIGGPSKIFSQSGLMPIYPELATLDNCNYSENTVWNKAAAEDANSSDIFGTVNINRQYICEADDLKDIPSSTYDAVISSHVIEHIADPLSALEEWQRVLVKHGALILIVPHKTGTFDHKRSVTCFKHLLDDYHNKVGPDDMTHYSEILEMHDIDMDTGIESYAELKQRSKNNFENRCLHHHVFDTELVRRMIIHAGYELLLIKFYGPCHIIAVARKV